MRLGLRRDDEAPLLFWPSRLDHLQKGCQLLANILYRVVSKYWQQNLQLVFVADGSFKPHFTDIVGFHGLAERVAVCDFDENLAHLAYAAGDYVLMPSLFEPCGLPQMIGCLYGALPICHDTGGIHDTVRHMDVAADTGNGFLFRVYDADGLAWAIDEAMNFHQLPAPVKHRHIDRVMRQSAATFNHAATARRYIAVYEQMLRRPLIRQQPSRFQRVSQSGIRKFVTGWDGIRRRQRQFERHHVLRRINSVTLNHLTRIKELRHG